MLLRSLMLAPVILIAAMAQEPAAPEPISESLQSAYFSKRPSALLHDPQKLLGKSDADKQLEFLRYHAGDSAIDLQIYLFKGDEILAGDFDGEALVDRQFVGRRPAVVVFYFLGQPKRAQLYLSPDLDEAVPDARRRTSLETSIAKADEDPTAVGQLEKFAVQMTLQIYWMEKLLEQHRLRPPAVVAAVPQTPAEEKEQRDAGFFEAGLEGLRRESRLLISAAAGLFVLLTLMVALRWRRSRIRFVDAGMAARLGGNYGAHCGSIISFASATRPPSRQRRK
ncbi:MAG TPA: hypothetical protein VFY13_07855 [Luteolibacter sp.]|nr:hypothetical protein [Luteolibacter sp.]